MKTVDQLFSEAVKKRMRICPTSLMNDLNHCIGVLVERGGDYGKIAKEFRSRLMEAEVESRTSALTGKDGSAES